MVPITNKKEAAVSRVIGHIKGDTPGPSVVFTGGIHGNEPSGVIALTNVLNYLRSQKVQCKGEVLAISGNTQALEEGVRFIDKDLNRKWTSERMGRFVDGSFAPEDADDKEQVELYKTLAEVIAKNGAPKYFMDLHTTSSQTVPFLTVNDSLRNRKFTSQFPVPIVLGIEEYLEGPMLSYINELGYIAFGFEGGEHTDPDSITNHEAFIYLTLVFSGSIDKGDIDYDKYWNQLAQFKPELDHFYEIKFRQWVEPTDDFTMDPGFVNFQKVDKYQALAVQNGERVKVPLTGQIFMPLYQPQGNDGFFVIRKIPRIFLHISAILRKARFDSLLPLLPGIKWNSDAKEALLVDKRVARFLAVPFLHLLGYRAKEKGEHHLKIKNREAASRKHIYPKPYN